MEFLAFNIYKKIGYVYFNRAEGDIFFNGHEQVDRLSRINYTKINKENVDMTTILQIGLPVREKLELNDINLQSVITRLFPKPKRINEVST